MKYSALILLVLSVGYGQGERFYFSINGIINMESHPPENILGLQCSVFKDSRFAYTDSIVDVRTEYFDGAGRISYTVLDKETPDSHNLFKRPPTLHIIHDAGLRLIDSINVSWDESSWSYKQVVQFFLSEKKTLYQQGYVFHKIDTTLSDEKLEKYIDDRYDIRSATIDNSDLSLIEGVDIQEKGNDSFTVITNGDYFHFIKHSKFEQAVNVETRYYFLIKEFWPSTGMVSHVIYTPLEVDVKPVLMDGSLGN